MWNSSATSRSPGGQPGDRCIHRQGRARCAGRMCGERRDAHIGGRGFADSYGYKIPLGVLGGPGRRQCPRWGLARSHPVQTWLAPLEKRLGLEYKSDYLPCLYRIQNPCYSLKNCRNQNSIGCSLKSALTMTNKKIRQYQNKIEN